MDSLLLDFEDVGRLITFSHATIANWAYRRKPAPRGFPEPIKVGRLLRYRRVDIECWIAKLGPVGSGSSSAPQIANSIIQQIKRPRGRPRLIDRGDHG